MFRRVWSLALEYKVALGAAAVGALIAIGIATGAIKGNGTDPAPVGRR